MPTCRHSSPLHMSAPSADKIWLGAARNKGLSTAKRLTISQTARPTITETAPAIWKLRLAFGASTCRCTASPLVRLDMGISIHHLRHPRQEQPIHREAGRNVTKLTQRIDDRADLAARDLAGRLEQVLAAQEIVRTLDVVLLGLAVPEHQVDGFGTILLIFEPRDPLDDDG